MKRKESRLLALTLSVLEINVRTSWPCAVPIPVRKMTARQPPSGVHAGSPGLECRTLVPPNSTAASCVLRRRRDKHPPPAARLIPSGEASIHPRAWHHHRYTRHGRAASRQEWWSQKKILMRLADCGLYINIKTPSVNINTHLVIQHLLEEVHQSRPWPFFHHDCTGRGSIDIE